MRTSTAIAFVLVAAHAAPARAIDVRAELTAGRDFLLLTHDIDVELVDGQLGIGAGMTMISDYASERYGAQALLEYRAERFTVGVAGTYGPEQDGSGWASLDPHGEGSIVRGRWRLSLAGGVLLRRIADRGRRRELDIDQLQIHAATEALFDDRWRAAATFLYSFYDPDLSTWRARWVDVGLLITVAGKPERWGLTGELARRIARKLWIALGTAGIVYADGRGSAVAPRGAVELGPWRGFSIGASVDVVVDVRRAAHQPVAEIGGLQLEYER